LLFSIGDVRNYSKKKLGYSLVLERFLFYLMPILILSDMEKQSIKFFTLVVLMVALLSSCTKTTVNNEVYVDSYITSIFDRTGVPVYTLMHTAYSYTKIASISVSGGGVTTPLLKYGDTGLSFYNPTDTVAYTKTVPAAASYTYNVTYDSGESTTKTDATSGKSLMPAQGLSAVKSSTDIVLSWKAVANVEAYKVRIFSQDATTKAYVMIYESDFLTPKDATSDLSMPFSLVSFSPYLNSNISFEVSSFIFEANQNTYEAVSAATIYKYFGV
jgi:hypothetical protein